jgi:chromate transporter
MARPSLGTIAREWGRLGVIGFGGPPTHIALLRQLCVEDRQWLTARTFEDGIAAANLMPGPASTQLAIFCAWRLRGRIGALIGGTCFILPGLVVILALSALFLGASPPRLVLGLAAGATAAVPVVAIAAALGLLPASWKRARTRPERARWAVYVAAGVVVSSVVGTYVVVVLAVAGAIEIAVRTRHRADRRPLAPVVLAAATATGTAGLAALVWVAFKVGALSYGGGFVIVPLMQHDAVDTYGWMTGAQFLNAVALGQVTPGPVVLTVAAVGYAAAGVGGGVLAAVVAFTPSFVFVMVGAPHFDRIRRSDTIQAFLTGAGAAALGAIAGAAVPLALALSQPWQLALLAAAAAWALLLRRGVLSTLLLAAAVGATLALVAPGVAVT